MKNNIPSRTKRCIANMPITNNVYVHLHIRDFKPRKKRSTLTLSASSASGRPGHSFRRSERRDGFVVVVVFVVIFIARIHPVMTRERGRGRGGCGPRSPGVVLNGVRWPTSLRIWMGMGKGGTFASVALSPYFGGRRLLLIIAKEGGIIGYKSNLVGEIVDFVSRPFTLALYFFDLPFCLA